MTQPKNEGVLVETLIIGSGFGGLCIGAKLLAAGRSDFVILEKADALGGTWRENTYPGAECDIPSVLYSFSFWQNPTWDFKWAKQKQILSYMNGFADAFSLRPYFRFNRVVKSAHYDPAKKRWKVVCANRETYLCRFFVSAVGQLHYPQTPNFKGQDDYKGETFHSAQWDAAVALAGKDVGVIGNAASAVQFLPEIAETARHLTVYQRTPNWVITKGDRPYSNFEKFIGKRFPPLTRLYRFSLWALGEYLLWPMIQGKAWAVKIGERMHRRALRKHISDPDLRAKLTPDFPIGAKRVLLSDKFYPTLAKETVSLETAPISHFTSQGIVTQDGESRAHDVIIYGTGFKTNPFLNGLEISGLQGTLSEHWRDGAFAYLGVVTAGFPNLFMIFGPNTNTGHTSIIFKIEQQVGYILKLMDAAGDKGSIAVKKEAEAPFNQEMQDRLDTLAWSKIATSWYKDGDRVTNNWCGSSREYKKRLAQPIAADFEIQR